MSGNSKNDAVAKAVRIRRFAVRGVLVVLYFALAIFMFFNGREHTLLLDNKSAADGSTVAFRRVKVYIDRQEPIELYARDRDMIKVRGQGHRIRIETQEATQRLEAEFVIDLETDMVLLSVPRMAGGFDDFAQPFVVEYERPKAADEPLPSLEAPVPLETPPSS